MVFLYELTYPIYRLQTVLLLSQLFIRPKDIRVVLDRHFRVCLVIICIESHEEWLPDPYLCFHISLDVIQVQPVLVILPLQESRHE